MKFRSLMLAAVSALALSAGFTSCDDDDEWNPMGNGKVEMESTRAFILNEGSYQQNNANIIYFDFTTDLTYSSDLFVTQNGKQLGDTGQDIITEDGYVYVAVYGSNYVAKLNGYGVEQTRISLSDKKELGNVRYMAEDDGYLYVTSYGGYVNKIRMSDMSYVGSVKVGNNPEQIIEEDGKLYCVNSGMGHDNRLSIIDTRTFKEAEHVEIFQNPEKILEENDRIFVQGYGGDYTAYDYQVGEFNPVTKKYTRIATATNMTAGNNKLYLVNSVTNWNVTPYETNNTFFYYDLRSNKLVESSFLTDAPEDLATSSVYGMSVNPYTGDIYICTSSYTSNGFIYHFKKDGTFVNKFSSNGMNPKKIVFLR